MRLSIGVSLVIFMMVLVGASPFENSGSSGAGTTGAPPPITTTTGSSTSTTGISGGTTGTTTTGGTTGSTSGAPWQANMRIERAEEWASQTTYQNVSGSTHSVAGVHVARMVLQVGGPPPTPPGYTSGIPWTLDSYSYTVGVLSPGEEGNALSGGSGTPYAASVPISLTTTSPGVSASLSAYGEVPVQISGGAPIGSGGSFTVTVACHVLAHYINPSTGLSVPVTAGTYTMYGLNFNKILMQGSAIDTRRVFGIPNLAGELPTDPNAPARDVDFTNWVYHGGSFVGSMPPQYGTDESGLSRIQLWGPGPSTGTLLAETAVMADLGCRTSPTGAETVGAYIPSSGDLNAQGTAPPSPFNWSMAWAINPQSTPGTPIDYSRSPISTLALGSTGTNDYLNWVIADTSSGGWIMPPRACNYLCFALTDETTGPSWHYFGGSPFDPIAISLPGSDSQPRIWWVGLTSTTSWLGPN